MLGRFRIKRNRLETSRFIFNSFFYGTYDNHMTIHDFSRQLTMKGKLSVDFKVAVGSTPTTLIVAHLIHHSIGNVNT